jgi:AcrR family transcriptional regulator
MSGPITDPVDLTAHKKLRADTLRTRKHLLDVLGRLLEERGLDISLPDLAKEAGVATATVYRHFDDLHDLREEFYRSTISDLISQFEQALETSRGRAAFERFCSTWVTTAANWARAATFIRSAEGYLERVRRQDGLVTRLHRLLTTVIDQLVHDGDLPAQDPEYAALMWITLFDERVLVDLSASLGWTRERISQHLSATLLAALGGS